MVSSALRLLKPSLQRKSQSVLSRDEMRQVTNRQQKMPSSVIVHCRFFVFFVMLQFVVYYCSYVDYQVRVESGGDAAVW
jgi:hypothetical protein